MDKKSPIRRPKRQAKVLEENFWDCSVCTYRNTPEAFKCSICDVRKGTSTRKPRLNPQLVAQQVATQFLPATSNNHHPKKERKDKKSLKKRRHPPRLKNIDRSSGQTREVTVNSVTVVITEYKPKSKTAEALTSSSSSDHGSHSESSMDARWRRPRPVGLSPVDDGGPVGCRMCTSWCTPMSVTREDNDSMTSI